MRYEKWIIARKLKIIELREAGKTYREISEQFNISIARVSQLYHQALRDKERRRLDMSIWDD